MVGLSGVVAVPNVTFTPARIEVVNQVTFRICNPTTSSVNLGNVGIRVVTWLISVGSKQIKDNKVTSKDVQDGGTGGAGISGQPIPRAGRGDQSRCRASARQVKQTAMPGSSTAAVDQP